MVYFHINSLAHWLWPVDCCLCGQMWRLMRILNVNTADWHFVDIFFVVFCFNFKSHTIHVACGRCCCCALCLCVRRPVDVGVISHSHLIIEEKQLKKNIWMAIFSGIGLDLDSHCSFFFVFIINMIPNQNACVWCVWLCARVQSVCWTANMKIENGIVYREPCMTRRDAYSQKKGKNRGGIQFHFIQKHTPSTHMINCYPNKKMRFVFVTSRAHWNNDYSPMRSQCRD